METNQSSTPHRVRWWDGVWALLLALYMLAGTPITPFHGDESTLIFMSRDYAYLFIEHDLDNVRYSDSPLRQQEQDLRLLNGTVGKYAMGLAWHLGGFESGELNDPWDWGADWNANIQMGHMPSEGLLLITRWSSSLMMAVSMIVLFAIGWHLRGRRVAYTATLYYALSPAVLVNGHRTVMEGSFALFNLLTVLTGMWLIQRANWSRALLLGVFGGLALASKHTAAFTLVAVFGAIIVACFFQLATLRTRHGASLQIPGYLIGAGIIALLVFYALNPAWWGDPVGRAQQVLDLRENLLAIQVNAFSGYDDLADKLAGFVEQVFTAHPQYYEVCCWQDWIDVEIAAYESSPWAGLNIGGTTPGAVLLVVLIVIGGWQSIRQIDKNRWLLGCWALVMLVLTMGLTPLNWQRYYLPIFPVVGLLAALGVDAIWRWMVNRAPRNVAGSIRGSDVNREQNLAGG